MSDDRFSKTQWEFLAVFEAFGAQMPIDIAGALVPLTPGPLMDLLKRGNDLITLTGDNNFVLVPTVPSETLARLSEINTPQHMARMLERIDSLGLSARIDKSTLIRVMQRAGLVTESARLACEFAQATAQEGDPDNAMALLIRAQADLALALEIPENVILYIKIVIELSRLSMRTGKFNPDVPNALERARVCAEQTGDRRSWALIGLHLSRFYIVSDQLDVALANMHEAQQEVENLGDDDIRAQTAEFLALYFYLQGLHQDVANTLEHVSGVYDSLEKRFLDPLTPVFYSASLAFIGQFHRALGILNAAWRLAEQKSKTLLAVHYRATLGVVLFLMGKEQEAGLHLNESSKAALDNNNLIAYCIAEITLAYAELRHDRIRESYARASWCLRRLAGAGIIPRQYPAPFLLEMLQAYHQRGYEPLPFFDFPTEVAKLLTGPNVHLKGVALRISAAKTADDASPLALALLESEACLKRSGDRVELAKTRCEMARCMLRAGDQDAAREQALKASEGLSGLNLFPDDLVWILDGIRPGVDFRSDMTDRLFEMMENFLPNRQTTDYLGLMLDATSRFFKAERAGLFWFEQKSSKAPVLRSGKNLTGEEVSTEGFREQLALIFRSLHENRVHRIHHAGMPAVLCIPLEVEGKVQAVIYHDNTYLDDCFDFLDDHTLMRLKRTLGTYLEKIIDDERRHTESEQRIPARLVSNVEISNDDILTQDERMLRELSLLDQVAASDATALISGETGVGKELFAHRIHRHSPRQGGPFIVVDLASLPESLVESELFGHEKGAFTGADAQRIGKIELADKGTLFIDELGEIPRSVQVKLLRALQEKSVMRLGGSRLIASDFRLVAATNRNLSEEVKAGRFREDLYYRINVVPIEVPPLRERGEDIVFIARRFMATAARQFNRIAPDLTRQDEQMLMDYQWPGNVRELKNVIERAVLLSSGDRLELMLSAYTAAPVQNPFADKPGLEEVQRRYIMYVLETTGGRISGPGGAAEILGMPRTTLNARMKKLGLR